VVPWRGRPWKLCLNDECPSMAEMKRRREERERAKAAKEAAEASEKDGKTAEGSDSAVKEAEKIAGQASATKVKRARNGGRTRAKSGGGSRAKPRAKS
jgi:hypothetical protein